MTSTALILPGYGDSGPTHWQSLWAQDGGFARLTTVSFSAPRQSEWVAAIDQLVEQLGPETVLVAHSLACLAVAAWSSTSSRPVRGALLVAPPDPAGPLFPSSAAGFDPPVLTPMRFPAIVVMSTNDPYASGAYQRSCAEAWRCRVVDVGNCGHINGDSGLGRWPEGRALLDSLISPAL